MNDEEQKPKVDPLVALLARAMAETVIAAGGQPKSEAQTKILNEAIEMLAQNPRTIAYCTGVAADVKRLLAGDRLVDAELLARARKAREEHSKALEWSDTIYELDALVDYIEGRAAAPKGPAT